MLAFYVCTLAQQLAHCITSTSPALNLAACVLSCPHLQLAHAASKAQQHSHSFTTPSTQQQQGQHRSQGQHLADHGVLKLLLSAVCNPWLLVLCVMGVLLASASNTYVFFLPMIINALLQGKLIRSMFCPGAVYSFVGHQSCTACIKRDFACVLR